MKQLPLNRIKSLIIPKFDEQAVFLMGFAFVGLFFLSAELRGQLTAIILEPAREKEMFGVFALLPVIAGFLLAAFHVLSRREKSKTEKEIMLCFGAFVSLVAGLHASTHMFMELRGLLIVFPVWNIMCAGSAFWVLENPDKLECFFHERDTSLLQLIIGVGAVGVILWFFSSVKHWHWSEIFSVAVFYTESIDVLIRKAIEARYNIGVKPTS